MLQDELEADEFKRESMYTKKKQKKSLKVGREGHFTSLLLADNSICSW